MNQSVATWWRTVGTDELRASRLACDGLVELTPFEEPVTRETIEELARAVALQQLVFDSSTFESLVGHAKRLTKDADKDGRPESCEAVAAWLRRCSTLLDIFKRTLELLGPQAGGEHHAFFTEFLMHVTTRPLNTSEAFSRGTTRSLTPSRRLILRGKA